MRAFLFSRGRLGVALALVALALPLVACRQGSSVPSPTARSYVVQGTIEALPDLSHGRPDVLVRHQAIPDFVDREGRPAPMDGMTMPFPIAPAVNLAAFRPGQAVEMTLQVDWDSRRPFEIVALRPLP